MKITTRFKLLFAASALVLGCAAGIAAAGSGHGGGHSKRGQMMQKFDANGDGQLSDAERAAAKAAFSTKRAEHKAARLARFDTNRNGTLEPAEKRAAHDQRVGERFAKLDANGDGAITLAEMKAAKAMHGGKHRGGRGGGFGGPRGGGDLAE